MSTHVVNIRFEPYDVYIGRTGHGQDGYFGNPYNSSNRDENIARFEIYFNNRLKRDPEFRSRVHQLKDKRLGCFCKPHNACHGDIIANYLNNLPPPIKLAVVGSRSFENYEFLKNILQWYDASAIISGGAKGADSLAAKYAAENGIPLKEFPADWNKNGRAAGYMRNKQIVAEADEIVAFWDKQSVGTGHTVRIAEEAGKPVHIYWPSEDPLLDWA